jgi:hypothetical protein
VLRRLRRRTRPALRRTCRQIELARVTTRDAQAPVSRALFAPTTQWVDVANGVQIAVYGGSAPAAAGAAAIYVWISDLNAGRDLAGTGMFVATALAGPLLLTGVAGDIVTFTCPDGIGIFDLASHEFRIKP